MNNKNIFLSAIMLFFVIQTSHCSAPSSSSSSSQPSVAANTAGLVAEKRKYLISFRTVATYKVGNQNHRSDLKALTHPFLNESSSAPYSHGNGGLLNPLLTKFSIHREPHETPEYSSVEIAVNGCVAADGFAESDLNSVHRLNQKEEQRLEKAISGALRERLADRPYISKRYRPAPFFLNRFKECITLEWTSKQNKDDDCTRTPENIALLLHHMPQDISAAPFVRRGESEKEYCFGRQDPFASVKLRACIHELNFMV